MSSRSIITLTTDFGLRDHYVAAMKGVVLTLAPASVLVDISHEVAPHNVSEAGYLLSGIWQYFPTDAIHVAVVDPGVGTGRKAIAVRSRHGTFVAPDNGLLYPLLVAQGAVRPDDGALVDSEGVELDNPAYHRMPVSNTFHGRDIFAPAAAHLAVGINLESLGSPIDRVLDATKHTTRITEGEIRGTVVHIDRFGNAITNISADKLPANATISTGGLTLDGVSANYQIAESSAIVGSSGLLEIAVRNGSAADTLGLRIGDEVVVRGGA